MRGEIRDTLAAIADAVLHKGTPAGDVDAWLVMLADQVEAVRTALTHAERPGKLPDELRPARDQAAVAAVQAAITAQMVLLLVVEAVDAAPETLRRGLETMR